MTRKRFNTITIAAMIAILALGSLGLGYAYWTTELSITTTASAGNASAKMQDLGSNELVEKLYQPSTNNWSSATTVPYADCSLEVNGSDPKVATVTATGMFPGYTCELHVNVYNDGTVPIKSDFTVAPYGVEVTAASGDLTTFDVGIHDCDDIIEPNTALECHITLRMNWDAAENNTTEGDTVTFTMHPKFKQAVPAS